VSDPIKKLAGQTVVYGLGTIVPRLLNFALTPILTYGFTTAEFGINSELFAYVAFLNVIFTYGMETAYFNFSSRLDQKENVYNTSLSSLITSTFFFTIIILLFSGRIAEALSTPNATYLPKFITWCILIIATDALMVIPFAKLRSENKALKFSLLKLTNVVLNFGLTIFLLVVCKSHRENNANDLYAFIYNPDIGIGYVFLAMLVANIITLLFLAKQFMVFRFSFDRELLKKMLHYSWPLIILGLAGMVNETLDRIILKKLMVDKAAAQVALGIYGGCYKIAILMTIFRQAFQFAADPFFFGRARDKDSKQLYAIVMKYFIIFCLFLLLATIFNLHWIRNLVDKEYWTGLKVVPILLIANLCLGVMYNLSIWFKLSNQTRFGVVIALFGAFITILINVIFVPRYSYMACAWATLAAYASMMVLSYFLGQKYYPIKYNLRAIAVYVVITAGLYFLAQTYSGMQSETWKLVLNNLLILIFGAIVYKLEFSNIKKFQANAVNPG